MHSYDRADPSTPNAANVQKAMDRLWREHIAPYELAGNRLSRESYDQLLLPWNCSPPVDGFLESGFTRIEWDRDGKLSGPDHFFTGDKVVTIERMEEQLSTASMVTRWIEAHPQLAGTEHDVVKKMSRELRKLMEREGLGGEELIIGSSFVLLLFKTTGEQML